MSKEQDNGYCHDEDALLRDDIESTNAENTEKKNSNDSTVAMIANMNQTMVAVAGNISSMGNALKRIHADTEKKKPRLLVALSSPMRRLGMNRPTW